MLGHDVIDELVGLLSQIRGLRIQKTLARCVELRSLIENGEPDFLFTSGKRDRYNLDGIECIYFAEDEETARMLGINADRVAALACALGFALAALAGAFVAPIYSLNPGMGLEVILMSFLVIIVGGLGSITGTVLAGILIGVFHSLGGVLFGPGAAYGLVFVVMIAVLIVRPAGLLGRP